MGKLEDFYLIPPFSVFDTKQSYWQKRKNMWLEIGIKSEEGRGNNLLKFSETVTMDNTNGTSIFDPVICEICYKWFCPKGGKIFDNFAGGSVRGIVAAKLGYKYTGIDLSKVQIEANKKQGLKIVPNNLPTWIHGDSRKSDVLDNKNDYDLIFTCPPYYDLEVYSDGEGDMSAVSSYKEFLEMYEESMKKAIAKLKNNRFMIYTITNIRDKEGFYRDFVSDTIALAKKHGLHFYNDIILVNCVGTLALRIGRQFSAYRKVGKMHQNILVFYKGDNFKNILKDFGEIEIFDVNQKGLNAFSDEIEEVKEPLYVIPEDKEEELTIESIYAEYGKIPEELALKLLAHQKKIMEG